MKDVHSLLLLIGIGVINGAPVKNSLSAPHVIQVITYDPAGIRLMWDPVESPEDDPITGYRMKVWELSKKTHSVELDENGESKIVEKKEPIKDRWSFDYTKAQPKWIVDVKPEDTEAEVNDVNFNIFYELRVQALTKSEEGPLSGLTRLAIKGSE